MKVSAGDPRRRGRYCFTCGKRVYVVRNMLGESFLVAHDGTRWHQ